MDTYRGDFTVNGSEFSYRQQQQQQARLAANRGIITGDTLVPQNPNHNPNIVYNQLPRPPAPLEIANSTTSSRATRQIIIRRKKEHEKFKSQEFGSDSENDSNDPPIPTVLPPKLPNYQFDDPMQGENHYFDQNNHFHTH